MKISHVGSMKPVGKADLMISGSDGNTAGWIRASVGKIGLMHTALHKVVGVVDISSSSASHWLHSDEGRRALAGSYDEPPRRSRRDRVTRMPTVESVDADVHQLAVDLLIELERFQRHSPK